MASRNLFLRLSHGVMRRRRGRTQADWEHVGFHCLWQNLHHRLLDKRSSTVGMQSFSHPSAVRLGISTRHHHRFWFDVPFSQLLPA